MEEDNKFCNRSACWQIVIGDRDIDVTHDGVIVSVHSQDDLKSVAFAVSKTVERTILAMQENHASRLILQSSWE